MNFPTPKLSLSAVVSLGLMGAIAFSAQCGAGPAPILIQAVNNTSPVARVGDVGAASVGSPVTLDGTTSYDPDGDEIIYLWSVEARPEASAMGETPFSANDDRNAGTTTVVPDVAGVFTFALNVQDPSGALSDTVYVIVSATPGLDLPLADAGANQTGLEGSEVCLDGVESYDPNGHPITFAWTLVSLPDNSGLNSADIVATGSSACITPDAPGSYAVALVVNNGIVDSEPDFAFIAAGSTNQGPRAVAEVVSAASCDFIAVTGENSTDPEGDVLSYRWEVLVVPGGSTVATGPGAFDDPFGVAPSFYADVEGEYTVQLVVTDGEDFSVPVFLDIDVVKTTVNSPPVVGTSPDAYFASPSPTCQTDSYGNCTNCPNCPAVIIPLDAFATTDPDGDLLSISWAIGSSSGSGSAPILEALEGMENELTIPGPPGSCTGSVSSRQVQIEVTATDCSGATGIGLITFVYDCG
jgi:hypothetical protein